MDQTKLDTASGYVNNLLLARGLLRNGQRVQFTNSQFAGTTHADTLEVDAKRRTKSFTAAADLINLVHDLILRRDRDQEQQESLSLTIRTLRAQQTRGTVELDRLRMENQDLRRRTAAQESATRAADLSARTTESHMRVLRDEVQRLKLTVSQVRTQSANDIRKRDTEVSKLKTHLASRQRGNKGTLVGASITICPGLTARGSSNGGGTQSHTEANPSLEDAEYSLHQETNDFLTQLSQGLSEENDSLVALIRNTASSLKSLLGLPHNQPHVSRASSSLVSLDDVCAGEAMLVRSPPTSCQTLSVDLESVLNNLTELLTNPSFAPIEEVTHREDEIRRLREGWEKMEARWQEAVVLMQSWRRRMLDGGKNVNVEELKTGLQLGEGLDSASRRHDFWLVDDNAQKVDVDQSDSSELQAETSVEDHTDLSDIDEVVPEADFPIFEDGGLEALDEAINPTASFHGRSLRECGDIFKKVDAGVRCESVLTSKSSPPLPPKPVLRSSRTISKPSVDLAKNQVAEQAILRKTREGTRMPKTRSPRVVLETALNVNEKLQMAEDEARAAPFSPLHLRSKQAKEGDRAKVALQGCKRPRISGQSRRRKSTLSPEELEQLLES